MVRITTFLAMFATVLAQGLTAQVSISTRMSKQEYLAGEPIVLFIDVKNIGEDTVAYGSGCDFDIEMSVPEADSGAWHHKEGCFTGQAFGGCWGIDHPPGLASGQSITFKRLLVGYQLDPGSYVLKTSGKASMEWWQYSTTNPKHNFNDPVEGDHFSNELPFQVRRGTEDELRHIFEPWMEQAETGKSPDNAVVRLWAGEQEVKEFARNAIAETAPPFLEEFVRKFAVEDARFAIGALRKMNTSTSRQALVELFEGSKDPEFRVQVMSALAEIADPDQVNFFAGLLTPQDAAIQEHAIRAMGRIGGWRAVQELARIQSDNDGLNEMINNVLAITRSGDAVPVLIERYGNATTQNGVCNALTTLTHLTWCGSGYKNQARHWKKFWRQHRAGIRIYGDDDCEGAFAPQPLGAAKD